MGESKQPQNVSCRVCDKGDSNFDIRHTLLMNAVYSLPFGAGQRFAQSGWGAKLLGGWQLSGLLAGRTGIPIAVSAKRSSKDLIDTNTKNQRPDLVYGVPAVPVSGQAIDNWLSLDAFAQPAKNMWGNLGRNNVRGPGFFQVDVGLKKSMPLTEALRLEFGVESFNLFNHANFAVPNADLSKTPLFGKITQILNTGATGSGTPRQIQFSLRLSF
jgi:hypothetical protein